MFLDPQCSFTGYMYIIETTNWNWALYRLLTDELLCAMFTKIILVLWFRQCWYSQPHLAVRKLFYICHLTKQIKGHLRYHQTCSASENCEYQLILTNKAVDMVVGCTQRASSLGQSHSLATAGAWAYRVQYLSMWASWVCVWDLNLIGCFRFM